MSGTRIFFGFIGSAAPSCRRSNGAKDPELQQIGRLAGVDIALSYKMETYPEGMGVEFELSQAKTAAEKQQILQKAEATKARLVGKMARVLLTVEALLARLPDLGGLPSQLTAADQTEANYRPYFSQLLLNTFSQTVISPQKLILA